MPAHLAAMAAVAVGYASAQECEEPNQTLSQDMEDRASFDEERNEESVLPSAPNPMSIRSMHASQRSNASQHRSMDIKLSSVASSLDEDKSSFDHSIMGFCDGDFGSGKVKNIRLPTGCWVMAYSEQATVLAAGLYERLDFFETQNYSVIYSLPRSDKVSAIKWLRASALSKTTTSVKDFVYNRQDEDGEIMAVAGLDGQVSVYSVSIPLLEFQGVQLEHEFQVHSQVRCMALEDFGEGSLLLAVGDKLGKVTLSTLRRDTEGRVAETHRTTLDLGKDPVLGLDITFKRSILIATTKGGKVVVYGLNGIGSRGVEFGEVIWTTQRNGPVRAAIICGKQFAFGGYDKSVVLVDTDLWAIVRVLSLKGTVNTISKDPLDRFLVVGCRDKSLTFYDTSTYFPVKRFQTPGWVTSISWSVPGLYSDLVAVRSENKRISLIDLTPIHKTCFDIPAQEGMGSSLSWSPKGQFLATIAGDEILVTDSRYGFNQVASIKLEGCELRRVAFCPVEGGDSEDGQGGLILLAAVGLDGKLHMLQFSPVGYNVELLSSIFVEENLWVVAWSGDGKLVATGGKGKHLHVFSAGNLERLHSLPLEGRIWDIGFIKHLRKNAAGEVDLSCGIAVASGDYKAIFYDTNAMQPTLEVIRPRTVRCLNYHPNLPLLATGDGSGLVAIVDYLAEETIAEFEVGGRVNVLEFSPKGDYLLIGTDGCHFTLHETTTYKVVQAFERSSFALTASFSPTGKWLGLGNSNENYSVIRLGPLLGIDLVPLTLQAGVSQLPRWALNETLYRSSYGPCLIQRHMTQGGQDSLQWVATTLKEHPDAIYALDRSQKEGCVETALRLRKIKLLKIAVTTIVDGTLETQNKNRSILTTAIPEIGQKTLQTMLDKHPPEFIVEILKQMTFVKVPFTKPHPVSREKRMCCASPQYIDPWVHRRVLDDKPEKEYDEGRLTRTPAVLPLPNLGTMKFLSALLLKAPPTVFDNEAMGLVLRVMWQNHMRKYFIVDTIIFVLYFILWIVLLDSTSASSTERSSVSVPQRVVAVTIMVLNSVYAVKELIQSDLGRRSKYFRSLYNYVDILSIIFVYTYTIPAGLRGGVGKDLVPLAVLTTLLLTAKLLSYLRAFHDTGWLVTVLNQNFKDVGGFMVVLLVILIGFSVSFRLLFASNPPVCSIEIDEETDSLVQSCDMNPFGSLRRSFLSTFELTILGSYDPAMLHESQFSALAILTFIVAVTCVLVVVLNALISLLADSYARVQENASANRRKEKAELIVEYMSLLPPWKRRQIERNTKYFHALLEADADGDLVVEDDDWRGGLNALRHDMEEISDHHAGAHQKAMDQLKMDLEKELASFKKEIISTLLTLSDDVKKIQRTQSEGGVTFNGKRVAGAVNAVKEIGKKGSMFLTPMQKHK